jgi:DHA3 family tetracycline resistance protein-like MFS transporter
MSRDRRSSGGRPGATPIYLLLQGGLGFCFALAYTVNLVYQYTVVGLNPLQLVLVGTVLEGTAFLCEIPTGLVADTYSRRLSIIIGCLLLGLSLILQGAIPTFAAILLSQVVSGLGYTFLSGATEAWVADEVGEVAAAPLYLRGSQVGQAAGFIGIFASVGLASVALALPIVVSGVGILLLALALMVLMPEHGFAPLPQAERNSFGKLAGAFTEGLATVRASPILLTIVVIILFRGASSEAFDRLWQAHFVANFTFPTLGSLEPIVWFGIIAAVARIVSIGSTELVRRRVNTATQRGAAGGLFVVNALLIAAILVLALAGNFGLALGAYLVAAACRTTSDPIYTAWINRQVSSRVRATVLSFTSQSDALGQVAGGPAIGWVGTVASLRAALIVGALVLTPILPLLGRSRRQSAVGSRQ